jgi:hypothetical protein
VYKRDYRNFRERLLHVPGVASALQAAAASDKPPSIDGIHEGSFLPGRWVMCADGG